MLDEFRSDPDRIATTLKEAGLSGAGGAGFPSYVKWDSIDKVDYLLVNHQESEPNCYVDKWIGREYAEELATLFDVLLETTVDTIVIGAKHKDREPWLEPLEKATGGRSGRPTSCRSMRTLSREWCLPTHSRDTS